MKRHCLITLILCLMLGSCAKDATSKDSSPPTTPAPYKNLSERINESNGYKQDASGNWKPQNDRRSTFETKGASQFAAKNYQKSTYKTGDYAKTSWWGGKSYDTKSYAGNTDGSRFKEASTFQQTDARETNAKTDLAKPFGTSNYATQSAREDGKDPITKSSNSIIEKRRKVFTQPSIIDWSEQRRLSMEQSKGLLGR